MTNRNKLAGVTVGSASKLLKKNSCYKIWADDAINVNRFMACRAFLALSLSMIRNPSANVG